MSKVSLCLTFVLYAFYIHITMIPRKYCNNARRLLFSDLLSLHYVLTTLFPKDHLDIYKI